MVNAAVAVGQQTCKEDAMWKKIFDEDSETTPIIDQPSKSDPLGGVVLGSKPGTRLVCIFMDYCNSLSLVRVVQYMRSKPGTRLV